MNLKKTYKELFNVSTSKKDFTEAMLREFPLLKISTIERRYREFKRSFNQHILKNNISSQLFLQDDEMQEPIRLQQLLLSDAKRMNFKITRQFLEQHGFKPYEINWLIKRNELKDD